MKRIALIDGDEILYRICYTSQHTCYYVARAEDPEFWIAKFRYKNQLDSYMKTWKIDESSAVITTDVEVGTQEETILKLQKYIREIQHNTKADQYYIFLSSDHIFREDIATHLPYKGNRTNEKPIFYDLIKSILYNEYFALTMNGLEADDLIGIHNEDLKKEDGILPIICSQDKDMKTLAGQHYNPRTQARFFVSEEEAIKNFYLQLLTGDTSDNIPGLKGIGPKKAETALSGLNSEVEYYNKVKSLYEQDYELKQSKFDYTKSVDEIIYEIANLLRIKRTLDDKWEPPC